MRLAGILILSGVVLFLGTVVLDAKTVSTIMRKPIACEATPQYDANGKYIGCKTEVGDHENFSDPKGLTELGCYSFCRGINPEDVEPEVEPIAPSLDHAK